MMVITKAQRAAIKRVYDRQPLYHADKLIALCNARKGDHISQDAINRCRISYREFRLSAITTRDCVMAPWLNMWLGIEQDGYTHS